MLSQTTINQKPIEPSCWSYVRDEAAFIAYITALPKDTIRSASREIRHDNMTLLDQLIALKKYAAALALVELLDEPTLTDLLKQPKRSLYPAILYFECSDEKAELKLTLFNYAPLVISATLSDEWAAGKGINQAIPNYIKDYLKNNSRYLSPRLKAFYEVVEAQTAPVNPPKKILTGKDTTILLAEIGNADSIETIWREGLSFNKDLLILKKHFLATGMEHVKLRFLINMLLQANRLYVGADITVAQFFDFAGVKKHYKYFCKIQQCIIAENAWLKIVAPQNFADFMQQLSNYNYRPQLRFSNYNEASISHKYVHLNGDVVAYRSHKINKKTKHYYATKKQSCTLLNEQLMIPVFGTQHQQNLLVGYIFDQALCLPAKGFFKYDRGTYNREWVGDAEAVSHYQTSMKDISFRSMTEFRNYVREHPKDLNEGLARFKREACIAIVIARDCSQARKEAYSRAAAFKIKFKKELPIIQYNSGRNFLAPYREVPLLLEAELSYSIQNFPSVYPALIHKSELTDDLKQISQDKRILRALVNIIYEQIFRLKQKVLTDFLTIDSLSEQEKALTKSILITLPPRSHKSIYEFIMHISTKYSGIAAYYFHRHKAQLDSYMLGLRALEQGDHMISATEQRFSFNDQIARLYHFEFILKNDNYYKKSASTEERLEAFAEYFNHPSVRRVIQAASTFVSLNFFGAQKDKVVADITLLLQEYEKSKTLTEQRPYQPQ